MMSGWSGRTGSKNLPWWIRLCALAGLGVMGWFVTAVLPTEFQPLGFVAGACLVLVACVSAVFHVINQHREKISKQRLTVELYYVAAFLVVVGFGLAGYRLIAGPSQTRSPAPAFAAAPPVPDIRPWVSLDIGVAGPFSHFGDKPPPGRGEWHIPIVYRIQNTSGVPANGVSFFASIRPLMLSVFKGRDAEGHPIGPPTTQTDIEKELEGICDFPTRMAKHKMGLGGLTLFPGETKQQQFELNANPQFFKDAMTQPGYSGQILISVCVVYGTDPADLKYWTAKAFTLYAGNNDIGLNETVPPERLNLVPHPTNSGYAK